MIFYFDVNNGRERSFDEDGFELDDLEHARKMAVRELAHIIRDEMPNGERESYVVTVRDTDGIPVYIATATMIGEVLKRPE